MNEISGAKKKYWWETIWGHKEEPLRPQPFYCHWKNGKWDKKFRDKNGKVIE
jgi:hypothetical protein